jgi:branched-chain amino acid transport system substrate-binding protein
MKHSKKAFALLIAPLVLIAAGCSGSTDGDGGAGDNSAGGTVPLGVIAPMSGGFAQVGDHITAGFELGVAHAQADGLAADVSFDVQVKDDQADAQVASQAARDFMSDGTMLLGGLLTTPTCTAVAPLVDQAGGVMIQSVCAGNELTGAFTGEAPFERVFGAAPRDTMVSSALSEVLGEQYPQVTDYNVFGFDYAWGHDTWDEYLQGIQDAGVDAKVNQEYWVPLGETNFRSQVTAMSNGLGEKDNSGMFLSTYGAGTTAFLQQAEAFDLTNNVTLLAGAGGYEPVARALEGAAPEMWNAYDYVYPAFDNEKNSRFVEDFLADNGERPMSWSYEGYVTGYALVAAVDAAGSGDPDAVLDVLNGGFEIDGPGGSLVFDSKTHQVLAPVVVNQSVGDAEADETVRYISTEVIPAEDILNLN